MQRNQVFSLFAVYHTSRLCGSAAYEQDEKRFFLGGRSPPRPSRGWGHRETGFPHTPAGRGRGDTRCPHAPLREPRFTSAVHAAPPHTDGMKKGSSWEGVALPNPPRGRGLGARASGPHPQGDGETRFPHPPARGLRPPHSPTGGGRGKPGFPLPLLESQALPRVGAWGNPVSPHPSSRAYVHVSRLCDSRTTPDEHRLGARASRPRRVSAGTVTAPLPSPPPAGGRESGSSPQRGEVRRGVSAACA